MMRKILERCPSCGGPLEIREVQCTVCETQVRARYQPCDFCALTEEQSTFLRIFVMSRGNLSEVEKRLGVSYPTVRAKLDEVIGRLAASLDEPAPAPAPRPFGGQQRPAVAVRVSDPPTRGTGAAGGPGRPRSPSHGNAERHRILEAVARGEISAEEALSRIRAPGESHEDPH